MKQSVSTHSRIPSCCGHERHGCYSHSVTFDLNLVSFTVVIAAACLYYPNIALALVGGRKEQHIVGHVAEPLLILTSGRKPDGRLEIQNARHVVDDQMLDQRVHVVVEALRVARRIGQIPTASMTSLRIRFVRIRSKIETITLSICSSTGETYR